MANMLLTVFALICAATAGIFAWYAHLCSNRATASAEDLASGVRKLAALREEVETLHKRLDRVSGRVYAQARRTPPPDDVYDYIPSTRGEPATHDLDPELAAELALQTAPPVAPGKRSG